MAKVNKQKIIKKLERRHGASGIVQREFIEDVVDETVAYYLAIANEISDKEIKEVPEDHSFIIRGVASKQYNRRGSEGMEQEQVDGYRATYIQNDFAEYESFIFNKFKPKDDDHKKGTAVFI